MGSFALLHEVISLLEEFENVQKGQNLTLEEFKRYIVKQDPLSKEEDLVPVNPYEPSAGVEGTIGRLVTSMNRYMKYYIKKALEGSPLQSAEEFTYLLLSMRLGSMTKTELIQRNLQEKTTGTEIIRRLIQAGLICQTDDEHDKRSKQVSITQKGKEVFEQVFADMQNVTKIVSGTLSAREKETLKTILLKLETFHHPIFEKKQINSVTDLGELSNSLTEKH